MSWGSSHKCRNIFFIHVCSLQRLGEEEAFPAPLHFSQQTIICFTTVCSMLTINSLLQMAVAWKELISQEVIFLTLPLLINKYIISFRYRHSQKTLRYIIIAGTVGAIKHEEVKNLHPSTQTAKSSKPMLFSRNIFLSSFTLGPSHFGLVVS